MIGYASRTGTRENLTLLKAAGWGLLISSGSPRRGWRAEGFDRYVIDNGAWSAFQQKRDNDLGAFADLVEMLGGGAQWVAVPDVVAGGIESLKLSESWLPKVGGLKLVPVQDGMKSGDVRPLLCDDVGIFLGGSTLWKFKTMRTWGDLAREVGCYYHVARINSMRAIYQCAEAGADSFDGTSCTRYARKNLPRLERARRQMSAEW